MRLVFAVMMRYIDCDEGGRRLFERVSEAVEICFRSAVEARFT